MGSIGDSFGIHHLFFLYGSDSEQGCIPIMMKKVPSKPDSMAKAYARNKDKRYHEIRKRLKKYKMIRAKHK